MKIISIAKSYLGKTEKPNNSGFNDSIFEKKMEEVGFEKGHAWCSYFTELVFKEAYPDSKDLDKLFSASAVQTFTNFKNKYPERVFTTPILGSLVIWQTQKEGKPHWSGHAGICIEVLDTHTFKSIEGNTNDKGGREGYTVAVKTRKVGKVKNGLQVLGFIKI